MSWRVSRGRFNTVRLLIDHQKDSATVVLQARDCVIFKYNFIS
jgi:hypothetical protein